MDRPILIYLRTAIVRNFQLFNVYDKSSIISLLIFLRKLQKLNAIFCIAVSGLDITLLYPVKMVKENVLDNRNIYISGIWYLSYLYRNEIKPVYYSS